MNILPVKQPHEQYIHTISFQTLSGGDLVTYVNAITTLLKGTVDDSANIVLASLTSDGAANLTIRQGTDLQDYAIQVLISTSSGNVFEDDLFLLVREVH